MLYIVRHGETVWNVEGRYQGAGDSPMTEGGIAQAEAVAALLGGAEIDRLFTSPLGRAMRTAEIVASATGCEPLVDPRLAELSYGVGDGLTLEEIEARYPGAHARRQEDRWAHAFPGGESISDVWTRVAAFADERLAGVAADGNARVCVVAHNGVNRVLLGITMGWPHQRILDMRQASGVVWRVDAKGVAELDAVDG